LAERPAATYFQPISTGTSTLAPTPRKKSVSHSERPPTPSSVSMDSVTGNEVKEFDLDEEEKEDYNVNDRGDSDEDGADCWGEDDWEIEENRIELVEIDKDLSGLEQYQSGRYKYFTKDGLAEEQRSRVLSAERKLEVSEGAAEIMLRYTNWDLHSLIAKHRRDKKLLYKDAGCISQINNVVKYVDDPGEEMDCGICLCDVKKGDTFAMSCGHRYCLVCWKRHLEVAVKAGTSSGASAVHLNCPGEKCKEVIPKLVFEMILESKEFKTYQDRFISSFVDSSADLCWCTSPKCERIIQILMPSLKNISCACGMRFCRRCGADAHNPATCLHYNEWLANDKDGQGGLNAKYLTKACKPCPHCGMQTQKNGGCHYMRCTSCRKSWCWQCGKSDHHVFECNRPTYGKNNQKGSSEFYLFYYERYFNHKESLKAAKSMLQWAETTTHAITQDKEHGHKGDFLLTAANLVIECRDVLMWTYVYAYNLKTEQERRLFEHRQGDLEEYTEQLCEIIENKSVDYLVDQRFKIMELTKAISKYLMGISLETVR